MIRKDMQTRNNRMFIIFISIIFLIGSLLAALKFHITTTENPEHETEIVSEYEDAGVVFENEVPYIDVMSALHVPASGLAGFEVCDNEVDPNWRDKIALCAEYVAPDYRICIYIDMEESLVLGYLQDGEMHMLIKCHDCKKNFPYAYACAMDGYRRYCSFTCYENLLGRQGILIEMTVGAGEGYYIFLETAQAPKPVLCVYDRFLVLEDINGDGALEIYSTEEGHVHTYQNIDDKVYRVDMIHSIMENDPFSFWRNQDGTYSARNEAGTIEKLVIDYAQQRIYKAEPVDAIAKYDSWQEAYRDVICHARDFLENMSILKSDRTEQYIHLGIHDFEKDGTPELILGDFSLVRIFSYRDGEVVLLYDLYIRCVRAEEITVPYSETLNSRAWKDNAAYFGVVGASGYGEYVCLTYHDGKYYVGQRRDSEPKDKTYLNGEEVAGEEFEKVFDLWESEEPHFEVSVSACYRLNGTVLGVFTDGNWEDKWDISNEEFNFGVIMW